MKHETTQQVESCLPQPLTRRNADGQVYQRLAVVDRQIEEALGLNDEELRSRLVVRDEESPAFLKEESLVYLIRHHHAAGNRKCVNDLAECLLTRCTAVIYSRLGSLGKELADEGHLDTINELFSKILDLDTDGGDFLQVRFWVVLNRLSIQTFRKLVKRHSRESPSDFEREVTRSTTSEPSIATPHAAEFPSPEAGAINRALIGEALRQLEEPIRSAFLFRNYAGWPIEHRDADTPSISRHFGKTPRTIRNWLSKADEILEAWRGEQR